MRGNLQGNLDGTTSTSSTHPTSPTSPPLTQPLQPDPHSPNLSNQSTTDTTSLTSPPLTLSHNIFTQHFPITFSHMPGSSITLCVIYSFRSVNCLLCSFSTCISISFLLLISFVKFSMFLLSSVGNTFHCFKAVVSPIGPKQF